MIPPALTLFAPEWYEPVRTDTQVARMPGTADAPCYCLDAQLCLPAHLIRACGWPFCPWKQPIEEDT